MDKFNNFENKEKSKPDLVSIIDRYSNLLSKYDLNNKLKSDDQIDKAIEGTTNIFSKEPEDVVNYIKENKDNYNETDLFLDLKNFYNEEELKIKQEFLSLQKEMNLVGLDIQDSKNKMSFFVSDTNKFINSFREVLLKNSNPSEFVISFINKLKDQVLNVYDHDVSDPRMEDFVLFSDTFIKELRDNKNLPKDKVYDDFSLLTDGSHVFLAINSLEKLTSAIKGGYLKEYKSMSPLILELDPLSSYYIDDPESDKTHFINNAESYINKIVSGIQEIEKNPNTKEMVAVFKENKYLDFKEYLEDLKNNPSKYEDQSIDTWYYERLLKNAISSLEKKN